MITHQSRSSVQSTRLQGDLAKIYKMRGRFYAVAKAWRRPYFVRLQSAWRSGDRIDNLIQPITCPLAPTASVFCRLGFRSKRVTPNLLHFSSTRHRLALKFAARNSITVRLGIDGKLVCRFNLWRKAGLKYTSVG